MGVALSLAKLLRPSRHRARGCPSWLVFCLPRCCRQQWHFRSRSQVRNRCSGRIQALGSRAGTSPTRGCTPTAMVVTPVRRRRLVPRVRPLASLARHVRLPASLARIPASPARPVRLPAPHAPLARRAHRSSVARRDELVQRMSVRGTRRTASGGVSPLIVRRKKGADAPARLSVLVLLRVCSIKAMQPVFGNAPSTGNGGHVPTAWAVCDGACEGSPIFSSLTHSTPAGAYSPAQPPVSLLPDKGPLDHPTPGQQLGPLLTFRAADHVQPIRLPVTPRPIIWPNAKGDGQEA